MLERVVIYFFLFEQTGKVISSIYYDHFSGSQLSCTVLTNIYMKRCGPGLIITLSLINLKIDMIVVN